MNRGLAYIAIAATTLNCAQRGWSALAPASQSEFETECRVQSPEEGTPRHRTESPDSDARRSASDGSARRSQCDGRERKPDPVEEAGPSLEPERNSRGPGVPARDAISSRRVALAAKSFAQSHAAFNARRRGLALGDVLPQVYDRSALRRGDAALVRLAQATLSGPGHVATDASGCRAPDPCTLPVRNPPAPDADDALPADGSVVETHCFDPYGTCKYEKGFAHPDSVNPQAPKGGRLQMATVGPEFDSYTPFWNVRQAPAPGLRGLVYEPLMVSLGDNGTSRYGLVAQSLRHAKDYSWVEFHLNPNARFSNGAHVTAEDIEFSYRAQKKSDPYYDDAYRAVVDEGIQIRGPRTIRFALRPESERQAREAIQSLTGILALNKEYFTKHPIDTLTMTVPPIGTGPYAVASGERGKHVLYQRRPDYWAMNLPTRIGKFNYDEVRYDRYMDATAAREAFRRSGGVNLRWESEDSKWQVLLADAAQGRNRTKEVALGMPPGFTGMAFNTSNPLFQDPKVRRALSLALNYPFINRALNNDTLTRSISFFQGTAFANQRLLTDREKSILDSYASTLDKEVMERAKRLDPNPSLPRVDEESPMRENFRAAMALLRDAKWTIVNGKLVHSETNTPFEFEVPYTTPATERWLLLYKKDLERLGITLIPRRFDSASYKRIVDQGQYGML